MKKLDFQNPGGDNFFNIRGFSGAFAGSVLVAGFLVLLSVIPLLLVKGCLVE